MNSLVRSSKNRAKVCIVTSKLAGPHSSGGTSVAMSKLAWVLADAGFDVTIIYVPGPVASNQTFEHWIKQFGSFGIKLVPLLPQVPLGLVGSLHLIDAYNVHVWLDKNQPDIVFTHEYAAHCYYATEARRQGLSYSNTRFVVVTHGPTLYNIEHSDTFVNDIVHVERDFAERQMVKCADAVISPSQFLLNWLRNKEWPLPDNTIVMRNCYAPDFIDRLFGRSDETEETRESEEAEEAEDETAPEPADVTTSSDDEIELCFFGTLSDIKGLDIFCEAISLVCARSNRPSFKLTFIGPPQRVQGLGSLDYLDDVTEDWPITFSVLPDLDSPSALRYLSKPGRVAIMPSRMENSPYSVIECLECKIPFISTNVGGIPELVADQCHDTHLVEVDVEDLATRLVEVLKNGLAPATASETAAQVNSKWGEWTRELSARKPGTPDAVNEISHDRERVPAVSIIIPHYERPRFLKDLTKHLKNQTSQNFEVIIVDDASPNKNTQKALEDLETEWQKLDWRLIRREQNGYLGASRNTGAEAARGRYLMFIDDDDAPIPEMMERMLSVAGSTGAPIVTSLVDAGARAPELHARWRPDARLLFAGGPSVAGIYKNVFGTAFCLIERATFLQLGGYTTDRLGCEDWELYAKAKLAGYEIAVIPEPLLQYRQSEQGMSAKMPSFESHKRAVRPYIADMPAELHDLFYYSIGQSAAEQVGQVLPNGMDPKSELIRMWSSWPWRSTRFLRNIRRWQKGLPLEQPPNPRDATEAVRMIEGIKNSAWWDLLGPLRFIDRIVFRRQAGK